MTTRHATWNRIAEDFTAKNKRIVLEFYREFYVNQNLDAAEKYLSEDMKQHRPNLPNGRQTMIDDYAGYLKDHHNHKEEIKRVIADGDLVALHVAAIDGPDTIAVVDIFRVENGRIVEHWDVCQAVPKDPVNENTMF
jgi:predicted SnoaL-like aldol condensation-catalyzing enzyme